MDVTKTKNRNESLGLNHISIQNCEWQNCTRVWAPVLKQALFERGRAINEALLRCFWRNFDFKILFFTLIKKYIIGKLWKNNLLSVEAKKWSSCRSFYFLVILSSWTAVSHSQNYILWGNLVAQVTLHRTNKMQLRPLTSKNTEGARTLIRISSSSNNLHNKSFSHIFCSFDFLTLSKNKNNWNENKWTFDSIRYFNDV